MRAGPEAFRWIERSQADETGARGINYTFASEHMLADKIGFGIRHHPAEAQIVRRDRAVDLSVGDMSLFDAQNTLRLRESYHRLSGQTRRAVPSPRFRPDVVSE